MPTADFTFRGRRLVRTVVCDDKHLGSMRLKTRLNLPPGVRVAHRLQDSIDVLDPARIHIASFEEGKVLCASWLELHILDYPENALISPTGFQLIYSLAEGLQYKTLELPDTYKSQKRLYFMNGPLCTNTRGITIYPVIMLQCGHQLGFGNTQNKEVLSFRNVDLGSDEPVI